MKNHLNTLLTELGIKTVADFRATVQNWLPMLTTTLIGLGLATTEQAALWGALVTAIAGPGLSLYLARSLSSLRSAIYAVVSVGQLLIISYGLVTEDSLTVLLVSAALTAVSGGLTAPNIAVTSAWTRNVNGEADPAATVVE